MSTVAAPPASRARAELVDELVDAGLEATGDAGAFYPQPIAVLVGLPALVGRTLAGRTFEVPVLVVSGDPLNSTEHVDRAYAIADEVALVLSTATYRPSSWRSSSNAEPLPALELTVTVTVTEEGLTP
jgi:hypothetical protein